MCLRRGKNAVPFGAAWSLSHCFALCSSRVITIGYRSILSSVRRAFIASMSRQPDSKVNQFIRAVRTLIENGVVGVNYAGGQVYVKDGKAAVIVPLAIQLARDLLKREKVTLPGNIHLYDLLRQAKLVDADEADRCVRRIKVPGKNGPVELSALIFAAETIVPKQILSNVPSIGFEMKEAIANEAKPAAVPEPFG